jgi:hypothetical protein
MVMHHCREAETLVLDPCHLRRHLVMGSLPFFVNSVIEFSMTCRSPYRACPSTYSPKELTWHDDCEVHQSSIPMRTLGACSGTQGTRGWCSHHCMPPASMASVIR